MKIERIDAWVCHFPLPRPFAPSWVPGVPSPHNSATIYKVTTDDGLEGVAGTIAVFNEAGGYLPLLRAYLVGREVTSIEDIQKTLRSADQILGYRGWHIEIALWDIIGKAAGMPIAKLMGGARDRLNAYASTGELKTPERHVETCLQLQELGFKAVKLRVRHETIAQDVEVVEAVRDALGDDFTLMVDANQGWRVHGLGPYPEWDFKRAVQFARECEDLDVYWLEEPLYQHDYEGYANLRGQTDVRIAGGEMLRDLPAFREMIQRGALDIVQPDAALSGGIWMSRKISILAEAFGVEYAPHTWTNGIGLAANLQLMGAAANGGWCEYPFEPGSWIPEARDAMLVEPIQVDLDGTIAVPDRPGLGVDVNWETVEAHGERLE